MVTGFWLAFHLLSQTAFSADTGFFLFDYMISP